MPCNYGSKWEQVSIDRLTDREINGFDDVTSMFCPFCQRYHTVPYLYGNPVEYINYCPYCGKYMGAGPDPGWHDVTDPPKQNGEYWVSRHSAYGDFQMSLRYSVADDSWFEYDPDYGDEWGIIEFHDIVCWHELPEPPDGGDHDA